MRMFWTDSVGCDSRHEPGDLILHCEERRGYYILLYTLTDSIFFMDGKKIPVKRGTLLLAAPEQKLNYIGQGCGYSDDWINFYDPQDRMRAFGLPFNELIYLNGSLPIRQYLALMNHAYHSGISDSDHVISQLLLALFELLENYCHSELVQISHYSRLLELREAMYASPQQSWSVDELARQASLSRAYVQELYRQAFHVPFGTDLIQSRVQKAKRLLMETGLTVEEIAERCGYNSLVHLSRQFRQVTGYPPSVWREKRRQEAASGSEERPGS